MSSLADVYARYRELLGRPRELLVYALLRLTLPPDYRVEFRGYRGVGEHPGAHVPALAVYLREVPEEPLAWLEITGTTHALRELRIPGLFVLPSKLDFIRSYPDPRRCYILHILDGELPAGSWLRWMRGDHALQAVGETWMGRTRQGVHERYVVIPLPAWRTSWKELVDDIAGHMPLHYFMLGGPSTPLNQRRQGRRAPSFSEFPHTPSKSRASSSPYRVELGVSPQGVS